MINFRKINTLEGGYSTDSTENVERKNTFQKAFGGRLYSKNGVFSFSGGEGTKLIYENINIIKWLGFHSFSDELIVFAKCIKTGGLGGSTITVCTSTLVANSNEINGVAGSTDAITVSTEILDNSSAEEECNDVWVPAESPINFDSKYSCEDNLTTLIDLEDYYTENSNVPNNDTCNIGGVNVPINNELYNDCILSFKIDADLNFIGTSIWEGQQNWPLNGKITGEGVEENQFFKRVYYTDALNPRRVINLKDSELSFRTGEEFNQISKNILLQPEIVEVIDGGQLKTMKVHYVYRKISANGQASEFSPASIFVDILPEDIPTNWRGGSVSETTSKAVKIKINIIDSDNSSEVECIALEYETEGVPTAIRNLGKRPAASVVEFTHYGSEAEFADAITYSDIIDFKNTWKYCNDFSSKKNKLIAAGLRNEPLPTEINNLEHLFPLHSWKANGDTHDCLMNPEPWNYRYIDPSNTDAIAYVKQKLYKNISSFGSLDLSLTNTDTAEVITIAITGLGLDSYTEILPQVLIWLLDIQANDANFSTYFPNLEIQDVQGKILFTPIDDNIITDFSEYVLVSNNSQYVENFDNNLEFLPSNVDINNLVYGAQSIGFNEGVGVRVTYREFKEPLLNQATEVYDGTGNLLDFHKPSMDKFFMKGELYRIGFNGFNNDSTRLFAIPLGDLMIPNLGDLKSSIDDAGTAIITSQQYVNQSVEDGVLYGHGIKMHIEVRLSCELQRLIPMYQIVYVERNEDNRTIICQGISAPLTRVQDSGGERHKLPDPVRNKWNLPYYGGPTYEKNGFDNYDTHGENDQYEGEGSARRVMTHRGLMYFDSPDLYYNKISDQYVRTAKLNIVAKLNTDHTPGVIRERGGMTDPVWGVNYGNENYPKFSRKILEDQIEGDNHSDNLPKYNIDDGGYFGSHLSHFINISVLANYQPHNDSLNIEESATLKRGEEISGSALTLDNDISNNTFSLANQPWYYSGFARKWEYTNGNADRPKSEVFATAMTSIGYKTTILKTTDDLFTDDFIGELLPNIDTQVRLGGSTYAKVYDTFPLINLFRNNRESVFGGRSEEAYSRNTFIPLSKTIPTLRTSNNSQIFDVGGDTYLTLNIRTKNDFGDDEVFEKGFNNHGRGLNDGEVETFTRNGAWCYAVVLETQVEPKLTYQYEFYRENGIHNFNISRGELINTAYFNENNLKSYIPKPFKFKDDPDQGNVIAVSDVKLAGEYFDAWTVFRANNFYNLLEKNKGNVSNLVKEREELFAIQELQTSLIYIGTDRILSDTQGAPINLQQGSGTVIDGHKIISNYGTKIRRATIESDYGFTFFDERKIEFVKLKEPLLVKNLLHFEYLERFKTNPIIDTECYFDHKHKETCIRIRTKNGTNFTLSYNEVLGKFNGEFPFDNDLYMPFNEGVYSPINTGSSSKDLHQMNKGDVLNFFNTQYDLVLGIFIKADIDKVFQYKQVGVITNIGYPIKSFFAKSNLGYERTVLGTHNWYKVREGIHTVPMVNESNNPEDYSDIRGNWVYIEITAESLNKNKVDILAVLNDLRYSHQ
jgi:hypothetical protein